MLRFWEEPVPGKRQKSLGYVTEVFPDDGQLWRMPWESSLGFFIGGFCVAVRWKRSLVIGSNAFVAAFRFDEGKHGLEEGGAKAGPREDDVGAVLARFAISPEQYRASPHELDERLLTRDFMFQQERTHHGRSE